MSRLHRLVALPGIEEAIDAAADNAEKIAHQYATKKSDIAMTTSVGAGRSAPKLVNTLLERRDHENHDDRGDDERDDDNGNRIEQRGLDLALDGQNFFLVGRQAVEQGCPEYRPASPAPTRLQIQVVEIQRKLAERLLQAAAGLDVGLDVEQQTRDGGVVMALADDVERLQQRHAGLHHGGELAREQRDVLFGDSAAAGSGFS